MATLNLGRIKPVFRGAYSGSTAYVIDDIVTSSGSSYICIQAHGAGTQAVNQTAYWTQMAAGGTDVGTTITTQGDILYRDGSGLQRLAKPASNKFLQNTSGGVVSWETVSSNWVKLGSASFSGESEWVLDNCFTSDYEYYKFKVSHVKPSTNNATPRVQFRTGGASGTNFTSSNYSVYSRHRYMNASGDSPSANDHDHLSQGRFQLLNNGVADAGNNANYHLSASYDWHAPHLTKFFYGQGYSLAQDSSGQYDTQFSIWYMDNNSAFTGMRFYFATGNIASGSAILYGIKHS